MSTEIPRNILKLTAALLKHQAELILGKDALGIAAQTLVDIGGEKTQAQIDSILGTKYGSQELLAAVQRADQYFQQTCKDRDLVGAISLGIGDLPGMQNILKDMP